MDGSSHSNPSLTPALTPVLVELPAPTPVLPPPPAELPPPAPPRRHRLSRPARLGRWFIGIYLGYVMLSNVLIKTPLLRFLIHTPQTAVRLDWKSATSIWPGYVHMTGVRVDITDGHYVQVEIKLDKADPIVDLIALTRREFHLFNIKADGASLRMRVLRAPDEELPPEGQLPDMIGYPGPPRFVPKEDDGSIGHPWKIRADAADVDNLREIWIDRVRYQGVAHPIGPFEVLPGRTVEVGPADVDIINGSVSFGGEERAANVWGQIHGWLHKLTHAEMGGMRFARELDADVKLTCEGTGLGFLEGPLAPFKLARGQGLVSADVQVLSGVLQAGSHVRAESPQAVAGLEAYEARGPVNVDWLVAEDKAGVTHSNVHAAVAPFGLWMAGYPKVLLTAKALQLHALTGPLDLADLHLNAHLDASMVDGRVPDLKPFMEQLGSAGFVLNKGGAEAQVHFALDEHGRGHGDAKIETDKLEGQILKMPVEMKSVLALKLPAFDIRAKTADLSGTTLYITAFRASTLEDETGWWTTIGFEKFKLAMAGQLKLDAQLGIEARDGRPLLEPLWAKSQMPEAVRKVVKVPISKLNTRLEVSGKDVELGPFAIRVAGTDVLARLRNGPLGRSGAILTRTGPLSLGLGVLPAGFDTHFIGAEAWYREQVNLPSLIPMDPKTGEQVKAPPSKAAPKPPEKPSATTPEKNAPKLPPAPGPKPAVLPGTPKVAVPAAPKPAAPTAPPTKVPLENAPKVVPQSKPPTGPAAPPTKAQPAKPLENAPKIVAPAKPAAAKDGGR